MSVGIASSESGAFSDARLANKFAATTYEVRLRGLGPNPRRRVSLVGAANLFARRHALPLTHYLFTT